MYTAEYRCIYYPREVLSFSKNQLTKRDGERQESGRSHLRNPPARLETICDLRRYTIPHTPYPIYRIPLRLAGPAVLILVAWFFSWRCHSCCFYLSKLQITRVEPLSVFHIRFIIRCHCRRGSETSIRFTDPTSERIKYIIFVPSLMKGLS